MYENSQIFHGKVGLQLETVEEARQKQRITKTSKNNQFNKRHQVKNKEMICHSNKKDLPS
ncbi:hypothetical protein HHK02_11860 [Limosilactobacillus reuteri]|uniref:Uncharacterized protein n=1 Tax=Limosilactobacillus reuteri TaxID=1598 RepID=A0A0U5D779_LIMRT|nr:hypothetical protein [Limosilactobacillus reuteri]MQB79718.1 hypothetical protein [Limosilactobacillus reuteri]QLQ61733.1 hypothetical protein HHK02_11860 [Limosilactobacillus reuteri]CUR39671.1 hypothetical protein LRLP16767_LR3C6_01638 [Limosilactobacillus reuteri subsp. porcinus]CUR41884.1 hypothetical protein LRLP16767_LR202_01749 [Limosilactobacillus reuteri]